MPDEPRYTRHLSVDHDGFDASLVVVGWDHSDEAADAGKSRVELLRVPVEDIPSFLRDVVSHGAYALATAAERLEVGHCETCANTRLIHTVTSSGKPWSVRCSDCADRVPSQPFANAPQIGRREPRPEASV